ncbi:MAG: hypothetical protein QOF02_847 [Blastocatellia bacterium]|nr:hypothetical protein [Blastocatellia bacterium]
MDSSGNNYMTAGIKCFNCGVVNWPTAHACMSCATQLDYGRVANVYSGNVVPVRKSFSQKVARFFEITDYILLLPATLGFLYSLMLFPIGPLIIGGWYALGCLLLRGFRRHSRGQMSSSDAVRLWSFTFGYNLIELLVLLVMTNGKLSILYVWPILVLQLSAHAFIKDVRDPYPAIN